MSTKIIYLLFLSFIFYGGSPSGENSEPAVNNSIAEMLEKAEEKFEKGEEEKALELYMSVLEQEPENYKALWNASFLYTRKGRRQADFSSMEPWYRTAREIAEFCLQKYPDKPRSHYAFAVASAGLADEMPNSRERVRLIWDMKEHIYRAVELDPDYAPAWHLKGVWHSKLANISGTQRFAARFIYGSLPEGASNHKAEEYLKRAINMDQDVILFKLDLAQHYQESGQPQKAIPVLQSILEMKPVSPNDHLDLQEARERYEQIVNQ